MTDLTGKVALITGAAQGQGEAEARLFAARGARVVVSDVLRDAAEAVATDIGRDVALPAYLDVSDPHSWAEVVGSTLDAFGQIDILVNNAGIYRHGHLVDTDLADYRRLIAVNQVGVFLGMQAVVPAMAERRQGSIVNVVSISSFAPLDNTSAYASTKAAVVGMTKAAVSEFGPLGIRVNMIHPGGVQTEMGAPGGQVPAEYAAVPLGRIGQPEDIARVAAFLASDDSAYCSGAEIVVDGGWTVGTRRPRVLGDA
jgi:3alpha(or 20beta)-hydroxysteroid dehydrogenase